MRILILFFAILTGGCGSRSSSPGGDGGAAADLARAPSGCQNASDCRLYSSYCTTAPCQCIPLGAHDVDPPCVTGQQACIVDPCLNKTAVCNNNVCGVSQ
jgi:hypothetical protein